MQVKHIYSIKTIQFTLKFLQPQEITDDMTVKFKLGLC